ncbi:MAG: hypothetical protein E7Z87_06100 [Cyanobacteria bacterium SIG26]|nr:hypothetical protein [Cyanobacteria bacterium SIG26]
MKFTVFYKKLKIEYILYDFTNSEIIEITNKILLLTNNVKIISLGHLYCDNKKDLHILEKTIFDELCIIKKERTNKFHRLPNLIKESIKMKFNKYI